MNALETQTLNMTSVIKLGRFERRILKEYWRSKCEEGMWQRRHNNEIYEAYTYDDVCLSLQGAASEMVVSTENAGEQSCKEDL